MRATNVRKHVEGDVARLAAQVVHDGRVDPLFFEYPTQHADLVSDRADAMLAAALLPAMASGDSELVVEGPVSPALLHGVEFLQGVYETWYPDLFRRIPIRTDGSATDEGGRETHATFFSLGVDSAYTLVDRRELLTHLLYMKGLEAPLSSYHGQEADVILQVSEVADATGKTLVVGSTNLRDVFPLRWSKYYYGAGLAAVALSLTFDTTYVSSAFSYLRLFPTGASPLLDSHWSTEGRRIVHAGAEVNRAEKMARLADDGLAMRYLRVCTGTGGAGNCGQCPKCVRTMLALHIVGKLGKVDAFRLRSPTGGGVRCPFRRRRPRPLSRTTCCWRTGWGWTMTSLAG
jgi:hypothetical protein